MQSRTSVEGGGEKGNDGSKYESVGAGEKGQFAGVLPGDGVGVTSGSWRAKEFSDARQQSQKVCERVSTYFESWPV